MLATTTKEQPSDWDSHIQRLCLAYNSSIQATTGYTPFFLMFGREARLPLDLMYHVDTSDLATHSEYATRMKGNIEGIRPGERKVWPETAGTKAVL